MVPQGPQSGASRASKLCIKGLSASMRHKVIREILKRNMTNSNCDPHFTLYNSVFMFSIIIRSRKITYTVIIHVERVTTDPFVRLLLIRSPKNITFFGFLRFFINPNHNPNPIPEQSNLCLSSLSRDQISFLPMTLQGSIFILI